MDAKVVIQFLQQGIPPTHHNATLVHEVLSLAKEGWIHEFRHILREGNKCADFLANLGQSYPQGQTILMDPPAELLAFLEHDAAGIATLRV